MLVYPEKRGSIFFRNVCTTCQTARCRTPEDSSMNLHRNKNFKSQIIPVFILADMRESCWGFFLLHAIFVAGCQKLSFGPLGLYDGVFLGIYSYEGVKLPPWLQAATRQIFFILFACCDIGPEMNYIARQRVPIQQQK